MFTLVMRVLRRGMRESTSEFEGVNPHFPSTEALQER